jgi:hypothetical protein
MLNVLDTLFLSSINIDHSGVLLIWIHYLVLDFVLYLFKLLTSVVLFLCNTVYFILN